MGDVIPIGRAPFLRSRNASSEFREVARIGVGASTIVAEESVAGDAPAWQIRVEESGEIIPCASADAMRRTFVELTNGEGTAALDAR
jgi:regulatory protein YycI of two-component signal transduction system YycFG